MRSIHPHSRRLSLDSPVACGSTPNGKEEAHVSAMYRKLTLVAVCASLVVVASSAGAGSRSAIDPANFVAEITNQWFPLKPGTTYFYEGIKDGKPTHETLTVTHEKHVIAGVRATVIHDRLYFAGYLGERTIDYYAQDKQGNVWYLGETTAELDKNGHVTSREGTWLTGVNGAKPGIYIPGDPKVGQSARQEYYKGHAEDHFRVVSLVTSVSVPYLTSHKALLTKEWTPLEPGVLDHKYYVRGIGNVKEVSVSGPKELNALVSVRR